MTRGLLLAAAMLPLAALADVTMFAGGAFITITTDPPVSVPSVVGQDLTTADATLEGAGLDTGGVATRCSSEPANEVLTQSPVAGAQVQSGTLVHLVASDGTVCENRGKSGVRVRGVGIGL